VCSCIVTMHCRRHYYAPSRNPNVSTNFVDDRHFATMHFRRHRKASNQRHNIYTNFVDDWSNKKEIEAVFQNPRWRRLPS